MLTPSPSHYPLYRSHMCLCVCSKRNDNTRVHICVCIRWQIQATRAVVERHSRGFTSSGGSKSGAHTDSSLPPVEMRICEGSRGVTIKVSDQGGGISDEDIDRIWKYGYVYIYLCVCMCVCVCPKQQGTFAAMSAATEEI